MPSTSHRALIGKVSTAYLVRCAFQSGFLFVTLKMHADILKNTQTIAQSKITIVTCEVTERLFRLVANGGLLASLNQFHSK